MTEPRFNAWLKTCLQESNIYYKFQRSAPKTKHQAATQTIVLPLYLENNTTITGTAAVLEHFGQEVAIPCDCKKVVLPYDESKNTFDIAAARKHQEFLYSLQEHKEEIIVLQEHLTSLEKHLPDIEEGSEEQNVDKDEALSVRGGKKVSMACSGGIAYTVYDLGVASTVHSYYGFGIAGQSLGQLVEQSTSNNVVILKVSIWDKASMSSQQMLIFSLVNFDTISQHSSTLAFALKWEIAVGRNQSHDPSRTSFVPNMFIFFPPYCMLLF